MISSTISLDQGIASLTWQAYLEMYGCDLDVAWFSEGHWATWSRIPGATGHRRLGLVEWASWPYFHGHLSICLIFMGTTWAPNITYSSFMGTTWAASITCSYKKERQLQLLTTPLKSLKDPPSLLRLIRASWLSFKGHKCVSFSPTSALVVHSSARYCHADSMPCVHLPVRIISALKVVACSVFQPFIS